MAAKERFSEGNAAFVEEEYDRANELYSEAISEDDTKDEYFTARAQARIKLGNYADAVCDASKAIELNSSNVKSYLRKGIAQFHLEDYQSSADTLRKGLALDASDKNISTWLRKCEAELDLQQRNKANVSSENSVTYGCSSNQNLVEKEVPKHEVSTPNSTAANSQESVPNVSKVPMPSGPKTRYDWYQTETHVVITILLKNVKKEDLQTDIEERSLGVMIKLPAASDYSLHLDLCHDIVPAQSHVRVLGSKVEIKLKKDEGLRWAKLEGEVEDAKVKQFNPASTEASGAAVKYPSSSQHTRDWDKLVTEINKEEKDEKPEGDAAVNQLFQQIYADGSDEVRRAMNKSFVESGGTVLSTNWKEIMQKKTDVKPPDGMEYKNYS